MFRNYLKSAFRFLKRNKLFAGINALGLSIALAASFIILLYVINELSYNQCHKNRKQIYRVLNYKVDYKITQSGTPYILAKTLKDEFPQVENAVNTQTIVGFKLKLEDELINISNVIATNNSEVFDIFTIPLIEGPSQLNLLYDQNSIVLSRELAEKFFSGQQAIGQEISGILKNQEQVFIVTGVFEDIPVNSTLRATCMINSKWTNKAFNLTNFEASWDRDYFGNTWVKLSDGSNVTDLEKQFRALETKYIGEKSNIKYSLQPLLDVYMHSDNVANTGIKGNLKDIRFFSAIAFLIVLVAAINYILLSTAVSTKRVKEIGIRKTYGANSHNIKNQLLSESVLLALIVLPLALVFMWLSMPYAGNLFQTKLQIIGSNIAVYALVYLALTLLIGIFSGIYTSAYLSRLKIMDILKNSTNTGRRKQAFRSSLIVFQLVIFCSFVSSTMIIRSQYQYGLKKNPGHFSTNLLLIDLGRNFSGYAAYINSIKSNPNVISAAGTMQSIPISFTMNSMIPHFQNKTQQVKVEGIAVDYNFLKTMGISIIKGREFSEEFGSDLNQSCLLNETAVKLLGIIDPIGKQCIRKNIIGLVKDFNLHSIRTDIPPLMISMTKNINQIAVQYKPGTLSTILPAMESEWKKVAPERPFSYITIEEIIESIYSSEKNLSTIVSIFALFTLLIAAFGLFGLTLFTARTRTKEIGIKKVFGSSEKSIVYSFLKENFIMVVVASILAIPIAYYFMNRWLSNFSYKVGINFWFFVAAFFIAMLVVLLTVLLHSYRASRTNPVEALRYE